MAKRYFTVEEANGLLPAVQDQISGLKEIKKKFEDKYAELREKDRRSAGWAEKKHTIRSSSWNAILNFCRSKPAE